VPIPSQPFESIMKAVVVANAAVEELIAKSGVVWPDDPAIERLAKGEVVPTPTFNEKYDEPVTSRNWRYL